MLEEEECQKKEKNMEKEWSIKLKTGVKTAL